MKSGRVLLNLQMEFPGFELDVNLDLPGQGVTVFFGPSGCGKTTLLRCVAGLDRAAGRIVVKGDTWQDDRTFMPTHKRPLGYVFQEANLFAHLTVMSNLKFGVKRLRQPELLLQLEQAIELLGIDHLLDRKPHKLSGGERQRVAIAQALAMNPEVLLMDEPLAALDSQRKQEIFPYLERLHDELQIPLFYVTHSVDELSRLADHLVVLEQGKAVASGAVGDVLSGLDLPINQSEEAGVVLDVEVIGRDDECHLLEAEFSGGTLWARDMGYATGTPLRLRVLARDVSLTLQPQIDSSILNVLAGEVDDIADSEHAAIKLIRVKVGEVFLISRLSKRSVKTLKLTKGKSVWVQIKSVAIAR
jgi:molybdate transport system ATP-binding protein